MKNEDVVQLKIELGDLKIISRILTFVAFQKKITKYMDKEVVLYIQDLSEQLEEVIMNYYE